MANNKTGAQRYNDRMHKIFEESKRLNMKYHGEDRFGSEKKDNRSEAMKKIMASKMDKNDSDNLREYSRTDENGRNFYRMPMGTYKRKGDRYVKED